MLSTILQAWVVSLMVVCAEAKPRGNSNHFCQNRPDGSFDFFYFVLQWPGSHCSRGCCFDSRVPLPTSQFTIHGLWPTHVGGKFPCFCRASNIPGVNKIPSKLQQEMLATWPSFTCPKPKPEGLWKYVGRKHASCSGMDRPTYFHAANTLHTIFNIVEAFRVEGIHPGGQMYDLRFMQQVLESYIGQKPIITCSFNDMHQVYQIYEVYICLDKSHLLPFPCPDANTVNTKCMTPKVLFPEFKPVVQQPSCPANTPARRMSSLKLGELNPSDEEYLELS